MTGIDLMTVVTDSVTEAETVTDTRVTNVGTETVKTEIETEVAAVTDTRRENTDVVAARVKTVRDVNVTKRRSTARVKVVNVDSIVTRTSRALNHDGVNVTPGHRILMTSARHGGAVIVTTVGVARKRHRDVTGKRRGIEIERMVREVTNASLDPDQGGPCYHILLIDSCILLQSCYYSPACDFKSHFSNYF